MYRDLPIKDAYSIAYVIISNPLTILTIKLKYLFAIIERVLKDLANPVKSFQYLSVQTLTMHVYNFIFELVLLCC